MIKKYFYFKGVYHGSIWKSTKIIVEKNLVKNHQEVTLESTFDDLEADSLDLFNCTTCCLVIYLKSEDTQIEKQREEFERWWFSLLYVEEKN